MASVLQIKADGAILEDKDFSDELIKFSFLEQVLRAAVEVGNALDSPASGYRPPTCCWRCCRHSSALQWMAGNRLPPHACQAPAAG